MPTESAVRRALLRIKKKLGVANEDPVLQQAGLKRASLKGLDEVANASRDLLRGALDDTLQDWLKHDAPASWLKVLVLPPCDTAGVVDAWARAAGHQVLPSPQRHELTTDRGASAPDLDGTGLLVIPQLEHWFVRQRDGLRMIRSLLARLAGLERHCLIGCNSWAWRFLVKAAAADAMLPQPQTLAAPMPSG